MVRINIDPRSKSASSGNDQKKDCRRCGRVGRTLPPTTFSKAGRRPNKMWRMVNFDLEAALARVARLKKSLIVQPGKHISLDVDYSATSPPSRVKKKAMKQLLSEGVEMLAEFQDRLYAQDSYALLIIFQALDAAGKDGTIKHVMSGVNPQGCQVYSFKAPSAEELNHDYMWRCAQRVPERGRIGIFNRSYYEEVLVARVHPEILERQKIPNRWKDRKIWKRRFDEINNFEKYLFRNGVISLKFFLHVSRSEQRRRFLERIDQPEKNWKLSTSDVSERALWKKYIRAYEDCFNHTSTDWAPWYIIPADDKAFMRVAVAATIVHTLLQFEP
jgi:PPK2 family polyphosphate:nucleotide phosphotransferase